MTMHRLARATKRKSVPRKPMYFCGSRRPTSLICCSMPVTTISRRFCQRARRRSVESLRVASHEPTTSTNIKAHVKAIVPFSLTNPYCQKIMSSGLRRMTASGSRRSLLSSRAGQPRHDEARHDKAQEARHQPLPASVRHEVEAGQGNAHPHDETAEEPQRRRLGRDALAHRQIKAAEEYRAE